MNVRNTVFLLELLLAKSLVKQFHADLSATDNKEQNVLDWAFNRGYASTIIFLLDESSIGPDLLN